MSNPVIEQLRNRRSVRNFTGASVSDADLETILRAAQQAPTSANGQQVSLVVTRDKATIGKIAAIAGGQPQIASADVFVTFVIDFNRPREAVALAGGTLVANRSAEGLVAGAVDVGIMLSTLQTAAESLGYGTTAIGGIRRNPLAMVELLGLPQNTFPLVGSTIGVPDPARPAQVKPRVPLESFAFKERYDAAAVAEGVRRYDAQLRTWWDAQGMSEMPSYAKSTAGYYQTIYYPTVAAALRQQGFEFTDSLE